MKKKKNIHSFPAGAFLSVLFFAYIFLFAGIAPMPAFAAADPSKSGTCICKQANGTVIQNLGTKQTELECSNTCHTTYSAQYPGVLYNYENLSTAQEIAGAVTSSVSGAVSSLGDSIMWVFNALLYTIFNIAGLTVSIGSTMLEFVLLGGQNIKIGQG